ncbi:MAG: DUF1579 domain-containing protein [Phycisphaerales bacterium JB039]
MLGYSRVGAACAAGLAASLIGLGYVAGRVTHSAGGAITVAQPEGEMDPAAMMEAWKQVNQTGEQHEAISHMAGVWDAEAKFWMAPGAEPMISSGVEKNTMVFGGRYLKSEFEGEFSGEKFQGLGYMGYSNADKKYQSVWMDSTGTAIGWSTGTVEGDTITLTGEETDPFTGEVMKFKDVGVMKDMNTRVFSRYYMMGDDEFKSMEITFTRQGQANRPAGNDANDNQRGNQGGNRPGRGNNGGG